MWFYERNGERKGPVDGNQIHALIDAGVVNGATFVWKEGMSAWTVASSAEGFPLRGAASVQSEAKAASLSYPVGALAVAIVSGLTIYVVLRLVGMVILAFQRNIVSRTERDSGLPIDTGNELLTQSLVYLELLQPFALVSIITAGFLYLAWIWRCARNIKIAAPFARVPQAKWAFIAYLIPLVNVVLPVVHMSAIWRHSIALGEPNKIVLGWQYWAWSFLYILSIPLALTLIFVEDGAETLAIDIELVSGGVTLAFALSTVYVVSNVTRHQVTQFD